MIRGTLFLYLVFWLRLVLSDVVPDSRLQGLEVATERPDWAQWFAHRYQVCQWTMAGRKGHPVFASVLEKIKVFFESTATFSSFLPISRRMYGQPPLFFLMTLLTHPMLCPIHVFRPHKGGAVQDHRAQVDRAGAVV